MSSDVLEGRSLQVIVSIFTITLIIMAGIWLFIDSNISVILGGLAIILVYYALSSPGRKEGTTPTEKPELLRRIQPEQVRDQEEQYTVKVEEPDAILQELPIETIEGIGHTYGFKLKSHGIHTVRDLVKSDPSKISEICDVDTERASRWISMGKFAGLESISEEDAEAIVIATTIDSIGKLANANANELMSIIQTAVSEGYVKVPGDYVFTMEKVQRWIDEAYELLNLDTI